MTVKINDGCIGCGACASSCEEVFTVDDVATVNEAAVEANMDCVKEAAESCPVGLMEIE